MSNPILPLWEYIPDGEPRVFGDRVYIYGSHDRAGSDRFCDFKLKVWSASINDLSNWICHGDIFHTRDDRDHKSDTDWTKQELFAPDVVEKDGKYYLYAYIVNAKGCVAVSDRPEGPFILLSQYKYNIPEGKDDKCFEDGIFVDPGVLVDDDGQVYIGCGFQRSYFAQINPDNMYEIMDGTYQDDIIPLEEPYTFFEACSLRKVEDTYYFIWSPIKGNRLVYATSQSPTGPYQYQGIIVDNGEDYPAGNNHGSICCIKGQWYIFYHRMTNGTIMSRRACVEKIEILPNKTIPQVEMTSLGFEESLSPYQITPAEIACVLKGGCFVTEKNVFLRTVTAITNGCIIGYKYFDFGEDYSSKTIEFSAKIKGMGCKAQIKILVDNYDSGEQIGVCEIGAEDGVYSTTVKNVTGRHAIYFIVEEGYCGWALDMFKGRHLFEFESFVFMK